MINSRFRIVVVLALTGLGLFAGSASAQTTYTWNDSTTDWTQSSAWNSAGPDWTQPIRLTDSICHFFYPCGHQQTNPRSGRIRLFANKVTTSTIRGAAWNLTGTMGVLNLGAGGLTVTGGNTAVTANINIMGSQTWDTGSGTVTMGGASNAGVLSGVGNLTKAGFPGPLIIDNNANLFVGDISVTGGTLSGRLCDECRRQCGVALKRRQPCWWNKPANDCGQRCRSPGWFSKWERLRDASDRRQRSTN